jgi:choline dehydrogenase-like flavoprotein
MDTGRIMNFAHYLGTTRMDADPRRSVVDSWHRAHDVPNLFVVDGSSFTTSADGIWDRRQEWSGGVRQ